MAALCLWEGHVGPGDCRRAVKNEKQCRVLAWMLFHWEKIGASVWGCVLL